MERIASGLNMSVLELLGFEVAEARRALKKTGVDYDELVSAITKTNARTAVWRGRPVPGTSFLAILSIPVRAESFQARRLRRSGGRSLPIAR
jgi:hypothetical protein